MTSAEMLIGFVPAPAPAPAPDSILVKVRADVGFERECELRQVLSLAGGLDPLAYLFRFHHGTEEEASRKGRCLRMRHARRP